MMRSYRAVAAVTLVDERNEKQSPFHHTTQVAFLGNCQMKKGDTGRNKRQRGSGYHHHPPTTEIHGIRWNLSPDLLRVPTVSTLYTSTTTTSER